MEYRSRLAALLSLSFVFLLAVQSAAAQQGTINGRVVDAESGDPIARATVELLGEGAQTATSDAGGFSFSVGVGSYSVLVTMIGYETARMDDVSVAAGATESVTIRLRSQALVLNPVVVTASRRQEKALDAPASVSTVSTEEIARTVASTTADHVRALPGIDMFQTGLSQFNVVARGFNNVFSGSLLTIMDNRYARVPSLRLNAYNMIPVTDLDIDRIEVSLGPGAALYGPNAASGVMHIITASPIDRPGTSVSFAGGERSVFHGQFRSAHSLADGSFGLKVSGQYFRGNDFELDSLDRGHDEAQLKLEMVDRDYLNARYSTDARMDFRFGDDAEVILNGGIAVVDRSIELTGLGPAQADGWGYQYAQLRFLKGRLFSQFFLNRTDSGCEQTPEGTCRGEDFTQLLRTGLAVVDQSRTMAYQFQYGFDLGGSQSFTYGVDWQRTEPRTGGTITGRNEDDDIISEVGAYVHSETSLGDKLELVTAIRVDDHSRLTDPNISPRAALVFKPAEDQNFRLTFNRAFGTPTTNNLFLDIAAGSVPILPGVIEYGIRAFGVPEGGLTFTPQCPGGHKSYCMYTVLPGYTGQQLPANAVVFWDGLVSMLPLLNPKLEAIVPLLLKPGAIPSDPNLATVFRLLNQAAAQTDNPPFDALFPIDNSELGRIDELRATIHNTFEVGYKGLLGNRMLLAADVYYADVQDFVGPLRVETPNVFLDPASVAAFVNSRLGPAVQSGLISEPEVQFIVGGLSALPLGTVVPDGVASSDLIVTYRNFGDVNYWGTDLAAQFLASDRLRINATYSFQSDECFDFNEDGDCESGEDIALNAPSHKGSLGFVFDDRASGFSINGRVRMTDGFPMNSGVYVGDIEGYAVLDAGVGYRLPFQPSTQLSLSATNLFDSNHREAIGAPKLGRLLLARVRYDF